MVELAYWLPIVFPAVGLILGLILAKYMAPGILVAENRKLRREIREAREKWDMATREALHWYTAWALESELNRLPKPKVCDILTAYRIVINEARKGQEETSYERSER